MTRFEAGRDCPNGQKDICVALGRCWFASLVFDQTKAFLIGTNSIDAVESAIKVHNCGHEDLSAALALAKQTLSEVNND